SLFVVSSYLSPLLHYFLLTHPAPLPIFTLSYTTLFRSHPFACPRPDTTVSSSQCPKVVRFLTSFGRFEIEVPILNLPLVSFGFCRLPFCLRTDNGTCKRPE